MEYYSKLSDKGQDRLETLLSQADTLFSYGWMREAMFIELRNNISHKKGYSHFCSRLQEEKELMFITEYFISYRSNLQSIIDECMNPYEDEDVVVGLAKERMTLIGEYASKPLSREWDRVRITFEDSWKAFARRRDFKSESSLMELRNFLHLVDKISLITDILNKHEGSYGLNLNYASYNRYRLKKEEKKQKMPRHKLKQMLIKALDMCRGFLWANTSMGVVFAVCKEDYGFEDNASDFERFMQEVLNGIKIPLDYGCPQNTIASARQSGEYLKHPISQWQMYTNETRVFRLLSELRLHLEKAEAEIKEKNTVI